jgi:hypothetical protein
MQDPLLDADIREEGSPYSINGRSKSDAYKISPEEPIEGYNTASTTDVEN